MRVGSAKIARIDHGELLAAANAAELARRVQSAIKAITNTRQRCQRDIRASAYGAPCDRYQIRPVAVGSRLTKKRTRVALTAMAILSRSLGRAIVRSAMALAWNPAISGTSVVCASVWPWLGSPLVSAYQPWASPCRAAGQLHVRIAGCGSCCRDVAFQCLREPFA